MPEAGGETPNRPAPSWGAGGPCRSPWGRGEGHSPDPGDIRETGAPLLPSAGSSTRGRPTQGAPLGLLSGTLVGASLSWSSQGNGGSWSRSWHGRRGARIPVRPGPLSCWALPCPALLQTPRPAAHRTLTPWVPSWSRGSLGPPNLAFPGQRAASGSGPGRDGERKASCGPLRGRCVGT